MKLPKSSKFAPPPIGMHTAVLCSVIDMGTQSTPWGERRRVQLGFALPLKLTKEGKPHVVTAEYNLSGAPSSSLFQAIEAVFGECEEELDLRRLLGAHCTVQVDHNTSARGRTYAKVSGIGTADPNVKLPSIKVEEVFLSLEPDEFDADVFERLPDFLREKIEDTPEYAIAIGEEEAPAKEEPPEEEKRKKQPSSKDLDDEIPF
jgi:hypothetical protein